MGHTERKRIIRAIEFADQLDDLQAQYGCLQTAVMAMGGKSIHLNEVLRQEEIGIGVPNLNSFLHSNGLVLKASYKIEKPVSLSAMKDCLENPKRKLVETDYKSNVDAHVVGTMFSFGSYENEPPHVVGILPRNQMSRNLREILKKDDSHVVVDSSRAGKPIYTMRATEIASNLNAFILNNVNVSMHVIARQ